MLKKVKNTFFILSFLIFIIFIINFYFSDKNIIKTNKYRSNYIVNLNEGTQNLPLLKNDTEDIIEYRDDVEQYIKKKKKYSFFCLIGKCKDE